MQVNIPGHHGGTLQFQVNWYREWMADAACADHPYWWWWLSSDDAPTKSTLPEYNLWALAVCTGCPVTRACLEHAIEVRAQGVIRAGVPMPEPVELADCETCGSEFARSRRRAYNARRFCYRCNPYGRQMRSGRPTRPTRRDRCKQQQPDPLAAAPTANLC